MMRGDKIEMKGSRRKMRDLFVKTTLLIFITAVVLSGLYTHATAGSNVCPGDTTTYNYNDYWDYVMEGYSCDGCEAVPGSNPTVTQHATTLLGHPDSDDNKGKYQDETNLWSDGTMAAETAGNKPKAEYQYQAGNKYKYSWTHVHYNVNPSGISQFAMIWYYYPKQGPFGTASIVVQAYDNTDDSVDNTIDLDGNGNSYVIYTVNPTTSSCQGKDDKGNNVAVDFAEFDLTPLMSRLASAGYTTVDLRIMGMHDSGNGATYQVQFLTQEVELAVSTCTDPDPATITITAPTSGSTVSGTYTIQAQVTGETAPDTMTNMQVTIAGSSACDGTYSMTWNAGTSRWEYNWDTSACGTGAPETGITIDVSGTDPDCNTTVNATQVNNITIDNTCSDPDPATLTITQPTNGTTVSGTYTVQVQVGTESAPDTMTNMVVNIAGSSACDVTNGAMTWNSTTSRWEYNWDTSACGTGAPETGITIDASGNDPDCGDAVNATQVTNITIDNTGPWTSITSCSDCHGQPPAEGTTRQRGARGTGQVIGSHNLHVTQLGLACTECHIDNGTPSSTYPQGLSHRDGVIDFVTIRGGSYSPAPGETDVDASGQPLQDIEDGTGLGSCSNTGCHGASSPVWGTSTGNPTCYQCHGDQANGNNAPPPDTAGDTSATDPEVGAHQAHLQAVDNYSSPIACNECHTEPNAPMDSGHLYDGTNDTTYLQAEITFGNLADGGDDGQANASPDYDYNTGTCSNVYCHDETYFKHGWGSGTNPTWNDTNYIQGGTTADCSKCHGYPPSTAQGHPDTTGKVCGDCHSHVNGNGPTFNDVTLHVNGKVEGGGDCTSCHSQQQGTARRDVSTDFGLTSHHISAAWANIDQLSCQSCHGDLITDQGHPGSATTDPITQVEDADTAGTYYSVNAESNLSGFETFCLSCHDANGAQRLGANANKPFTDSGDNTAPPDVDSAWASTFNHSTGATCLECHGNAGGTAGDTLNPDYNAHGSTGQKILRGTNQYDVCFQCHNTTINKGNLASEQYMDNNFNGGNIYQNNWNTIPDIQSQFSTTNYAYHPLLGQGRNQPADNLNNNWTTSNYRKADNATACPDGTCTGLDNNFVDGWESTSLVTCTDCHNDSTGTVSGPHGSSQPWILKGMDTGVTVTTAGAGTIQPNNGAPTNLAYIAANFCVNCHRADIYGWGSKNNVPNIKNESFARLGHLDVNRNNSMRIDCQATHNETGQGGYRNIGCMNCHGGGEVAGIHGSNLGIGNQGADEMGKRFMNGNSWQGHTLGDASGSVTCYTGNPPAIGQTMSSCAGQHTGGQSRTPNYYYQWQ